MAKRYRHPVMSFSACGLRLLTRVPNVLGGFQAYHRAVKNLLFVPRYRGHTIYHPVEVKYGQTKVRTVVDPIEVGSKPSLAM